MNNSKQVCEMKPAIKTTMYNTVTQMPVTEVCNEARFKQLKSLPFVIIEKVETIQEHEDMICGEGGVTPAFQRMWNSIGNK